MAAAKTYYVPNKIQAKPHGNWPWSKGDVYSVNDTPRSPSEQASPRMITDSPEQKSLNILSKNNNYLYTKLNIDNVLEVKEYLTWVKCIACKESDAKWINPFCIDEYVDYGMKNMVICSLCRNGGMTLKELYGVESDPEEEEDSDSVEQ